MTDEKLIVELLTGSLEPVRTTAEAKFADQVRREVYLVHDRLEQHQWDARKAFPISSDDSRHQMATTMRITDPADDSPVRSFRSPLMRKKKPQEELSHIMGEMVKQRVDSLFESYIAKLTKKIIRFAENRIPKSMSYQGSNDLWDQSSLTVTFTDDTEIVLSTKIITNYSSPGKPFHQFPTRLIN